MHQNQSPYISLFNFFTQHKADRGLPNTNRKLPSPLPPPPKITYPCPNIYIRHFNSKYYNCINLTQFHISVTIHLIFLPFLFFTPFFLLFLFFTRFFLLFLFFTPLNQPFVWIHHSIHHLQLHQ